MESMRWVANIDFTTYPDAPATSASGMCPLPGKEVSSSTLQTGWAADSCAVATMR